MAQCRHFSRPVDLSAGNVASRARPSVTSLTDRKDKSVDLWPCNTNHHPRWPAGVGSLTGRIAGGLAGLGSSRRRPALAVLTTPHHSCSASHLSCLASRQPLTRSRRRVVSFDIPGWLCQLRPRVCCSLYDVQEPRTARCIRILFFLASVRRLPSPQGVFGTMRPATADPGQPVARPFHHKSCPQGPRGVCCVSPSSPRLRTRPLYSCPPHFIGFAKDRCTSKLVLDSLMNSIP
jgi:hypothetical protein